MSGRAAHVTKRSGRPRGNGPRLSVGIILTKRFTLCAFANFVDVLRLAADEGDRSRPILCDWAILSDTMNAVSSSCGVSINPTEKLGDPDRFDYIVVVGGVLEGIPEVNSSHLKYLKLADARGIPLIGICTGVFTLHQAGLMSGYKCCVSWFHDAGFLGQFEGLAPVSDQIFVVDRNRLTCSGGVSSAHLAAYLVDKHVASSAASKSLHIMIIDGALRPEEPQPGIPIDLKTNDPLVRRALLVMQQNLASPLSISEIAVKIGADKRRLERHFRTALKNSPQDVFLSIRLTMARHMISSTEKTIEMIASECGFCDSSHLSRLFKRQYDCTPLNYRIKIHQSDRQIPIG